MPAFRRAVIPAAPTVRRAAIPVAPTGGRAVLPVAPTVLRAVIPVAPTFRSALTAVLLLALTPGCAPRLKDPLLEPTVLQSRERHVRALQADLAGIFAAPALERGLVGVAIVSLERHDVLFRYNADRLLMPASNMKIVTLAAAAERLGWDYAFETTIAATGPIVDGTVQGDLVVRGTGDPTLNLRQVSPVATFDGWVAALSGLGIRHVTGRLIGDDNAFDEEPFGQGWSWDYLESGYAAPIGALQVYEGAVTLTIAPGAEAGAPARVEFATPASGWEIENRAITGASGSATALVVQRTRGTYLARVTGTIAAGADAVTRSLAVDNPTSYLLTQLAAALERRGIVIAGGAVDVDDLPAGSGATAGPALLVHRSPPLREIARRLMAASQNLYAESLLRATGRSGPAPQVPGTVPGTVPGAVPGTVEAPATAATGKEAIRQVLNAWSIPAGSVVMADGSGLSRYNYLTADTIVALLRRMHDDPRHRQPWLDAFPVGGSTGTLRVRFVGTDAEGRVRAKTGSISNVHALSGYVPTADGEQLAFAILVNNVTAPSDEILRIIDAVVVRLATWKR